VEDTDFSNEFCRFLQANLPSVEAAEALLALAGHLPAMSEADAAKHLSAFRSSGLLDEAGHYGPADPALRAHVDTLAQAYRERPVTLIRIIYALRDGKIRSFADAFRLRKD